jgi:hypothetical protein
MEEISQFCKFIDEGYRLAKKRRGVSKRFLFETTD